MSVLNETETQLVHLNEPSFSNRGSGIDLPAKLDKAAGLSGLATILAGNSQVELTPADLGGKYGGSPVQMTLLRQLVIEPTFWYEWVGADGDTLRLRVGDDEGVDFQIAYHIFLG